MNEYREHNRLFAQLPPTRLFFRCAIPSMISMAVTSLYTIADGIFVGYYIGAEALAAINLVMPLIMMSFALSDMIAIGSSVQIAIHLGKQKHDEACKIFSFACLMIFVIAIVMGALAFLFARPLAALLGAEGQVADMAVTYMRVYAAFAFLIMHFFALDNYLRICGKVHYSMGMNVVMSLANIVLDWLFIGVFKWGIGAAALASCLSLTAGSFVCLYPFLRGKLILKFTKGKMRLRTVGNILANGSSEFFTNISGSVCMMIFNAALLSAAGYLAVAAFSIVMYVDSVVKSILFGMSDSLQPAISYNYGAKQPRRVRSIERRGQIASVVISAAVFLIMQVFGAHLITLFAKGNAELAEMSIHGMRIFSFSYLFSWCAILSGSFFTALNRPVYSLAVASGQTLVFPVLFLAILPKFFGLDGIWASPAIAGATAAMICLLLLRITYRQIFDKAGSAA